MGNVPPLWGYWWGHGQKRTWRTRVRVGYCSLCDGSWPGGYLCSPPRHPWANLTVSSVGNGRGSVLWWLTILWLCLQPWHPKHCTNTEEAKPSAYRTHALEKQTQKGNWGKRCEEQLRRLCMYGTKTSMSWSTECKSATLLWCSAETFAWLHTTNAIARCGDIQTS